MNIKVENKTDFYNPEIIVVSNHFNEFEIEVINWWFDLVYLDIIYSQDDIGVWKIKQLKTR